MEGCSPFRVRLREMMKICGGGITDDFTHNISPARLGTFQTFQRQDSRAFSECQAVTPPVERATFCGRKSLERVETRKDQLTERVITAGEDSFRVTVADERKSLADGVTAGGAGIGDDGRRSRKSKRPL